MRIIQMTGLSGAGKSTIARLLADLLAEKNLPCHVVDGDAYRKTLCSDLGFSAEDRKENLRRLALVAESYRSAGSVAIIAAINPYADTRKKIREAFEAPVVWIRCSREVLIRRDTKGLYKRALLPDGDPQKLHNLSGINDPYEEPLNADLIVDTAAEEASISAEKLLQFVLSLLPANQDLSIVDRPSKPVPGTPE